MSEVTIYKTGYFESAHLLKGHPKCGKLHGHSYRYEVWITGEPREKYEFVLDFHFIKDYFTQLDHSGQTIMSSCEKLVQAVAESLFEKAPFITKVKVRIWETATSYAEYERE